jgi:hypothetical protein
VVLKTGSILTAPARFPLTPVLFGPRNLCQVGTLSRPWGKALFTLVGLAVDWMLGLPVHGYEQEDINEQGWDP